MLNYTFLHQKKKKVLVSFARGTKNTQSSGISDIPIYKEIGQNFINYFENNEESLIYEIKKFY